MDKKVATKLVQALKRIEGAIWLCDDESDAIGIRDHFYWGLVDYLKEEGYEVVEDSRGYHAKKVSK